MSHEGMLPNSEYESRLEDVSASYGKFAGLPVTFFRRFSSGEIEKMDARQLAEALREIQSSYEGVFEKMIQYAGRVNSEILKRDPGAEITIFVGVNDGRSDADLAHELGESARYVQDQRLLIGNGAFKKKRGRPRKPPTTS